MCERGKIVVHVTARANQGAANEAIIILLAQALQVPKTSVEIVSGHSSSHKKIVLHRITAAEWQHFLQSLPTQTPAL